MCISIHSHTYRSFCFCVTSYSALFSLKCSVTFEHFMIMAMQQQSLFLCAICWLFYTFHSPCVHLFFFFFWSVICWLHCKCGFILVNFWEIAALHFFQQNLLLFVIVCDILSKAVLKVCPFVCAAEYSTFSFLFWSLLVDPIYIANTHKQTYAWGTNRICF